MLLPAHCPTTTARRGMLDAMKNIRTILLGHNQHLPAISRWFTENDPYFENPALALEKFTALELALEYLRVFQAGSAAYFAAQDFGEDHAVTQILRGKGNYATFVCVGKGQGKYDTVFYGTGTDQELQIHANNFIGCVYDAVYVYRGVYPDVRSVWGQEPIASASSSSPLNPDHYHIVEYHE